MRLSHFFSDLFYSTIHTFYRGSPRPIYVVIPFMLGLGALSFLFVHVHLAAFSWAMVRAAAVHALKYPLAAAFLTVGAGIPLFSALSSHPLFRRLTPNVFTYAGLFLAGLVLGHFAPTIMLLAAPTMLLMTATPAVLSMTFLGMEMFAQGCEGIYDLIVACCCGPKRGHKHSNYESGSGPGPRPAPPRSANSHYLLPHHKDTHTYPTATTPTHSEMQPYQPAAPAVYNTRPATVTASRATVVTNSGKKLTATAVVATGADGSVYAYATAESIDTKGIHRGLGSAPERSKLAAPTNRGPVIEDVTGEDDEPAFDSVSPTRTLVPAQQRMGRY